MQSPMIADRWPHHLERHFRTLAQAAETERPGLGAREQGA